MTHSFAPHYNYFRDYEPAIGRYPQSDPIGLDGGLNTYQYADANPVSVFDSLGQAGRHFPEQRRGGRRPRTVRATGPTTQLSGLARSLLDSGLQPWLRTHLAVVV